MDVKVPIIVVANRLPFLLKRNQDTNKLERQQCAGGLVTAVAPVVVKCKGIWVGWPGSVLEDTNEAIPESSPEFKGPTAGLKSDQVIPVHLTADELDNYYNGCCNATFWPLFHSMPDRALFQYDKWEAYQKVNTLFARRTIDALKRVGKRTSDTPIVWIHDYHLTLISNAIRQLTEEENLKCSLGFFLHIPFPPWDIFRLFPWNEEVLLGLLGSDVVGFHIEDYCLNFIDCCQRRLGCRVDRTNLLVEISGRVVQVRAMPIGIHYKTFENLARDAPKLMADNNKKIILGVDRLDYTKGLANRFLGFERLLDKYEEHRNNVVFLQVAVPSRTDVKEYQNLKEDIDQLVGRINGRFSNVNWSPIRYIYGCISQEELTGYYRDAAVCLVTPLRDGMNLVAKEYVACQVNSTGVLVLSPFAGAAETMHEALMTNPYELEEMSETIHHALTMDEDEREPRMKALRQREAKMDVQHWMHLFLRAMGSVDPDSQDDILATTMAPLTIEDFNAFLGNYIGQDSKLTLLLDYDGTLASIVTRPELAKMSDEMKKVLERLRNVPDVNIAIVSGRSLADVQNMVGISGLTFAGSHGLEILHPDGSKFIHPVPEDYKHKVTSLLRNLQEECCSEGAWVENKGLILTYHYRETPQSSRPALIKKAEGFIKEAGFKVCPAHCAMEARPPIAWDKGRASLYILRTMHGVDWLDRTKIIYAGDDVTDEDAMRALKGIAVTFRVTDYKPVKSSATRRIPSTDSVCTMLKWVEKHMSSRPPQVRGRRNSSLTQDQAPVQFEAFLSS